MEQSKTLNLPMFIIYMEILYRELKSILAHENFEDCVTGRPVMYSLNEQGNPLSQSMMVSTCLLMKKPTGSSNPTWITLSGKKKKKNKVTPT